MSMKTLINAVKTDLVNAAALSYVADANIFITPDEDLLPATVTFPAIGLKEGPIDRTMESVSGSGHLWRILYRIHVVIYVDMTAGETPVVGQASPTIKGILDMNADIQGVLHEDYQAITGVIDARCTSEQEGEVIGGSDAIVLKKKMTFEYEALESL